jgi:hypothetical protein
MKLYEIIGKREQNMDMFDNLVKENNREALECVRGFKNPLIVSNIIKCRMKCLEDKMQSR